MPRFSHPNKSNPVLNGKRYFLCRSYIVPPHINQKGSSGAELGRKQSIASANKECSIILSDKILRIELSIEKYFAIKRGSCNKPYTGS